MAATTSSGSSTSTTASTGRHRPRRAIVQDDRVRAPRWLYVVLTAGLVLMIGPFVWMVLSSVKPEAEIREIPPTWWPRDFTLANYEDLFTRLDLGTYFLNSVIVATVVTLGNVVFCSMLGYALAKLEFRGK